MFIKIEDMRINFSMIENYRYDKDVNKTLLYVSNNTICYSFKGDLTQALDLALQTKELKNV